MVLIMPIILAWGKGGRKFGVTEMSLIAKVRVARSPGRTKWKEGSIVVINTLESQCSPSIHTITGFVVVIIQ